MVGRRRRRAERRRAVRASVPRGSIDHQICSSLRKGRSGGVRGTGAPAESNQGGETKVNKGDTQERERQSGDEEREEREEQRAEEEQL